MERRRLLTIAAASTPTPITGGGILVIPFIYNPGSGGLTHSGRLNPDNPYYQNVETAFYYAFDGIPFIGLFIQVEYSSGIIGSTPLIGYDYTSYSSTHCLCGNSDYGYDYLYFSIDPDNWFHINNHNNYYNIEYHT